MDIVRYPSTFSKESLLIYNAVKKFTITSPEMVNALVEAVKYVVSKKIGGAMVECGVWRGGSVMAMALVLKQLVDESRDIYLYDTFSGMPAPTNTDKTISGPMAQEQFSKTKVSADSSNWLLSPLEEVKENETS